MILAMTVFLGGMLTILSPCVLPVLPFIFTRAEQPFLKNGLPMLAGMALTFAGVATLAAVGGGWAVHINQYGRFFALMLLAAFAATLLSRHLAEWFSRPFIALGNRLLQPGSRSGTGFLSSLFLGIATGLLWAPCAGPILGLILTGAALSGPNAHTAILLLTYAAGAATSMGIALLAGNRLFSALKKSLGAGEWIRRGLGVTILLAVLGIALGWDSSVLTHLSLSGTDRLEKGLIAALHPGSQGNDANQSMTGSTTGNVMTEKGGAVAGDAESEGALPPLDGVSLWLNSPPLTPAALKGKVVLIDFWTYSCINCLRSLPYVKSWYDKYKDHGLVVIGVHAPEFAFEKDERNVRHAVADLGIAYPVALDNSYAIWRAFNNHYWPAHYFIDATGRIRGHHFGEGDEAESEDTIRRLLTEAGYRDLPPKDGTPAKATGVQSAADDAHIQSSETYIGYRRASNFVSSPGFAEDKPAIYTTPSTLALNDWGLSGKWIVDKEKATLASAPGTIAFRFDARDLHLVMGIGESDKPIRFRVRLDGAAPGANHGMDIDADGNGVIRDHRLYQLIRQSGNVGEHTFSIEFSDTGVQAFSFTFG